MCMNVLLVCVYVYHMHAWYTQRWEEGGWSYGQMAVGGMETGLPAKAASAPNCWVTFPFLVLFLIVTISI